jgi:hypothetical protein
VALALRNETRFTCQPIPLTAKNGATILQIVVKGAFVVGSDSKMEKADEQPEVVMEDKHWGEPGVSSVRYESDIILDKPFTDLVINGHAYAPNGRTVTRMDVAVGYDGRLLKRLAVVGDRVWRPGPLGWRLTDPVPFRKIPIVYERAYGGSDKNGSEVRNRCGTGFASSLNGDYEGTPAPNIEFPDELIRQVSDRPVPAGLGVISKHWEPRLSFGGTYDGPWLEKQFPLLPADFDMRFFQSVAEDQWLPRPRGGEQVAVQGMTPEGVFRFVVPSCEVQLQLEYRDRLDKKMMDLDTILIEPDERRVSLTWRATADIHGDPFRLLEMTVGTVKDANGDCGCGH